MRKLVGILFGWMISTSILAAQSAPIQAAHPSAPIPAVPPFTIMSPSFHDNDRIPTYYTCNGENISPPLKWDNAPAKTKSFVLVLSSPDWVTMNIYLWVVYNIPPTLKGLDESANLSLPKDVMVATNFYNEAKYHGPCPPDDDKHTYVFTLYALDTVLDQFGDDESPDDVLNAIKPHILKEAVLKGTFQH